MGNFRFDWRWLIIIAVIVLLANTSRIPAPITALIVGASGIWLLVMGWQTWGRSGGASRGRVTYWRGQRIELAPPSRGPALPRWRDIGPAAPYFILGAILVLVALTFALRTLGF